MLLIIEGISYAFKLIRLNELELYKGSIIICIASNKSYKMVSLYFNKIDIKNGEHKQHHYGHAC